MRKMMRIIGFCFALCSALLLFVALATVPSSPDISSNFMERLLSSPNPCGWLALVAMILAVFSIASFLVAPLKKGN